MKTINFLQQFVKSEYLNQAGVMAITSTNGHATYWHVHKDEELPEDCELLIGFRNDKDDNTI